MKRLVAATLCFTALAAFCFSATAGDAPCFEMPEFVIPVFEQPQFEQPEFVQPEFVQPTFIQPEFHQAEFIQPEFIAPEFVSPEFDSQCSHSRTVSYSGYGLGGSHALLSFSHPLLSQKSSSASRNVQTYTVRSLASRNSGDYVAKSLLNSKYRYLLETASPKQSASSVALTHAVVVDDCPCHAHKAVAVASQPRLAVR